VAKRVLKQIINLEVRKVGGFDIVCKMEVPVFLKFSKLLVNGKKPEEILLTVKGKGTKTKFFRLNIALHTKMLRKSR
jgi:hypothetical protein